MKPILSILFLSWNGLPQAKYSLKSIFTNTGVPFELILINNGSTDGTLDYFKSLEPYNNCIEIKIRNNRDNLGVSKGYNTGFDLMNKDSKYITVSSNDWIYPKQWASRMIDWLDSEDKIGLVTACSNRSSTSMITDSPNPRPATIIRPGDNDVLKKVNSIDYDINKINDELYSDNEFVCVGWTMKKEVYDSVGIMDPEILAANDVSYTKMAQLEGFKSITAWDIYIHHFIESAGAIIGGPELKRRTDLDFIRINNYRPKMKLCGFLQIYNEMESGNLERCLDNMWKYCDYIVVYDDASRDGSASYCSMRGCDVMVADTNNFLNETTNKQELLDFALSRHKDIDWFIWLDADEILDNNGCNNVRDFIREAPLNGYSMMELNLWRSDCWERKDYPGRTHFTRLWRNIDGLTFNTEHGLHKQLYPVNLGPIGSSPYNIIHYGYATQKAIEDRWVTRNALGVSKTFCNRNRQFNESNMQLELISDELFPPENKPINKEKPRPTKWNVEI